MSWCREWLVLFVMTSGDLCALVNYCHYSLPIVQSLIHYCHLRKAVVPLFMEGLLQPKLTIMSN